MGACILVVFESNLIRCIIFLGMSAAFLVILTYLYRAPDVALTFAVVNSAATTVLFLSILKKVGVLKGDDTVA
ncbi:MAG: DUF4040 domain-containing protein [Thermoplasmata archaeon]